MLARDRQTNQFKKVYVKALDSMPVGTEVDFDGQTSEIPTGWEEIENKGKIYSTDEIRVGTWIDGKPVYQKVLTFETNVTAGIVITYNLNNNIDNLKRYISVNGFCYFSAYNSFKPIMAGITIDEVSNWSIALRDASPTKLTFNFGKSLSSAVEGIVILKYTKTTD